MFLYVLLPLKYILNDLIKILNIKDISLRKHMTMRSSRNYLASLTSKTSYTSSPRNGVTPATRSPGRVSLGNPKAGKATKAKGA